MPFPSKHQGFTDNSCCKVLTYWICICKRQWNDALSLNTFQDCTDNGCCKVLTYWSCICGRQWNDALSLNSFQDCTDNGCCKVLTYWICICGRQWNDALSLNTFQDCTDNGCCKGLRTAVALSTASRFSFLPQQHDKIRTIHTETHTLKLRMHFLFASRTRNLTFHGL